MIGKLTAGDVISVKGVIEKGKTKRRHFVVTKDSDVGEPICIFPPCIPHSSPYKNVRSSEFAGSSIPTELRHRVVAEKVGNTIAAGTIDRPDIDELYGQTKRKGTFGFRF